MGKLRTYSLAEHSVSIESSYGKISFSAKDNNVGNFSYARKTNHANIVGDAAGGAVMNINKDKTGTITLSINQQSPYAAALTKFFSASEGEDTEDYISNIVIKTDSGDLVVSGEECYAQKLPDEERGAEASEIDFVFEVTTLTISKE